MIFKDPQENRRINTTPVDGERLERLCWTFSQTKWQYNKSKMLRSNEKHPNSRGSVRAWDHFKLANEDTKGHISPLYGARSCCFHHLKPSLYWQGKSSFFFFQPDSWYNALCNTVLILQSHAHKFKSAWNVFLAEASFLRHKLNIFKQVWQSSASALISPQRLACFKGQWWVFIIEKDKGISLTYILCI